MHGSENNLSINIYSDIMILFHFDHNNIVHCVINISLLIY